MDIGTLVRVALDKDTVVGPAASVQISDVCDDSRLVTPGSLFVAVGGTKAHGRAFAEDAAARGAAVIVTDTELRLENGPPVIRVPDARYAVSRLAAVFYGLEQAQRAGEMKVIGVTGTNGKSTTVYLLRSLLQTAGRRVAMLGTIEYDLITRRIEANLTTPGPIVLTRHLMEAHAAGGRFAAMEVSSHSLDQRRTDGIDFSVGLFTNLTQDHLDYHRTRENYLLAKRRLFDRLGREATAVVNADDPASVAMVKNCQAPVLRFGLGSSADVRARILEENQDGCRFFLDYQGHAWEIFTPLVGRHNIMNVLGAATAGLALKLEPEVICRGVPQLSQVPGRLQRLDTDDLGFSVFVDYAHTDDALKNVLRALRPLTRGRLWCIFGCGGDRDRTKRPLMARAVAAGADAFIITSDNPRTEDPQTIISDIEHGLTGADRARGWILPDRAEAIQRGIGLLEPGDVLVIAGKGHENYQIFGENKIDFDDTEVAQKAIRQRQAEVACGC